MNIISDQVKQDHPCKHRTGVQCITPPPTGCTRCGWNLAVEMVRKARIRGAVSMSERLEAAEQQ